MEDAEDECRDAELTENKVKAALSSSMASTTTIGFGVTSTGADDAAVAPIGVKKANDISNLVRKRKPEEQTNGHDTDIKKPKPDEGLAVDKENGHGGQPTAEEVKSQ